MEPQPQPQPQRQPQTQQARPPAKLAERIENLAIWMQTDKEMVLAYRSGGASPKEAEARMEEFKAATLAMIRQVPDLMTCDPLSFCLALRSCARLRLTPDPLKGHCWLLPFNDNKKGIKAVQFILGYKGMMALAHRVPIIKYIEARLVHAGDIFEYALGLHPKLVHVPSTANRGGREITHAYAIARMADCPDIFVVLDRSEIDATKARSKASKYGPWVTDFGAMAAKTAVRRLFTWIPLDPAHERIVAAIEEAERENEVYDAEIEPEQVTRANFGLAIAQQVQQQSQPARAEQSEAEALALQMELDAEAAAQREAEIASASTDPEQAEAQPQPTGELFGQATPEPDLDPQPRKRR